VASSVTEFFSGGLRLSARLYSLATDDASTKRPGIVVCNGMRGVKEWIVPPFGEAFAAAGYVALVFDHRGMGESEGAPGRVIPSEQVEDVRSALSYLETLPQVDADRLFLWGTSFGGANAIEAAAVDSRVRGVVVQVPFGDWGRVMRETRTSTPTWSRTPQQTVGTGS
jgi:dienelactone hydrolase